MAESGERRMVFDTRGRRRNVIRVVYAILALLMGASLFLVIGPFNLGELAGTGGAESASKVLIDQAEETEAKLQRQPNDEKLLLSLTRSRIAAANASTEINSETGVEVMTSEGREQLLLAAQTWDQYLQQAQQPNPAAAQLVAGSFFRLAETGGSLEETIENIASATEAQRIAAESRPTVNSLTTLAIFEYYKGDFAAGDKAATEATELVANKSEVKEIEKQLDETRQRGKQFQTQKKEAAKQGGAQRRESLENPLGGLSGGGSLGE